MTKSNLFLSGMAILLIVFCLMFVHAAVVQRKADPVLKKRAEMVEDLEITDLCLFTEARYTRHPVMADVNTPFQDFPFSIEHYPTGSLVAPPEQLRPGR